MDPFDAAPPIHTRSIDVEVCDTGDGGWTARGELIDLRKRGFVPVAGDLQMAGLLHHMPVRARFDPSTGVLEEIAAEQPAVAFEASSLSRGECCRDPIRRIELLAGTSLTPGWGERLNDAIAGPRGCSHILTLSRLLGETLRFVATTERARPAVRRRAGERIFRRSISYDGRQQGDHPLELALQLTDVHFAPADEIVRPMARFADMVEICGAATIALPDLGLQALDVAERRRAAGDVESTSWESRGEDVSGLVGKPVARGMRRRVLECLAELADGAEGAPLVAVLLDLAPAVFQCAASRTEPLAARAAGDSSLFFSAGPEDSCYIWRRGGAFALAREEKRACARDESVSGVVPE